MSLKVGVPWHTLLLEAWLHKISVQWQVCSWVFSIVPLCIGILFSFSLWCAVYMLETNQKKGLKLHIPNPNIEIIWV